MSIWSWPGLKQVRQSAFLNTQLRIGYGQFWGCFDSRSIAEEFLAKSKIVTYDSDGVVDINIETFQAVHLFDWPVMFFFQKLHSERKLKVVTDFGGHVGAKYYAYRNVIPLPSDIKWQVVDVPAICKKGRQTIKQGDVGLSYHENIYSTESCDVLLCSGSLQYSDKFVDQVVKELPSYPEIIIINRMSVSNRSFYTLEAFNKKRMLHRVVTDRYLSEALEGIGYKKLNQWDIPHRNFTVQHQKGKQDVEMIGQIWVRN